MSSKNTQPNSIKKTKSKKSNNLVVVGLIVLAVATITLFLIVILLPNFINTIWQSNNHTSCGEPDCSLYAAKPVIYLYPQSPTQVSVKLDYDGTLTDLYPNFNSTNSWNVLANPNGEITNTTDNNQYSYLFWEGTPNYEYPNPPAGFVVKGSDTASFLQQKLSQLGLTPKEYNEMIVYWLPKLQHNPYNLIYFAGSEYTDHAKLDIEPKPDSVLRVFMVSKPLQEPVFLPEQQLQHFERKGFTVVEWGGTILK